MSKGRTKTDEQFEQALGTFFKAIGRGFIRLRNIGYLIGFLIVLAVTAYLIMQRDLILQSINPDGQLSVPALLIRLAWLLPIICLAVFGMIKDDACNDYEAKFASIKFCNKAGQFPELLKQREDGKKVLLSFKSPGIPLNEWRARQGDLETALDCNILKISTDLKTKTIINLETVPSSIALSTILRWHNDVTIPNASDDGFKLVAGQGLLEPVYFDLDKYPHALIAGTTGSGKSVVLKVLLWQCIQKGATPYMIDFKGGIELTAFERFGEVVYERDKALDLLKELNAEMKLRLALFREEGVKNLLEYNKKYPEHQLTRIVVACDEVAEMLDKTGLSTADAAIYKEIEKEMSSIARLGRAPGINMLLGTQRPDAKVIVGQIKNNLPIRISGRMTDVHASEMVLGNTKAADLGDIRGRFLYTVGSDTYEFQGYLFEDNDITYGQYQEGVMLLDETSEKDTNRICYEFDKEDAKARFDDEFEEEEKQYDEEEHSKKPRRRGLNYDD